MKIKISDPSEADNLKDKDAYESFCEENAHWEHIQAHDQCRILYCTESIVAHNLDIFLSDKVMSAIRNTIWILRLTDEDAGHISS